jgi:hypothetical protein
LILMVFIKDKGLRRKEEEAEQSTGEMTGTQQDSQVAVGEKQV